MINVKDKIYAAIAEQFDNVSDHYPDDFKVLPAIQYVEEENKVYEHTFGKDGFPHEDKSQLRFKIDIWDDKSTSQTALKIDEIIASFGFVRTQCMDNPSSRTYRHKIMRYEGIIDNKTEKVYWNR